MDEKDNKLNEQDKLPEDFRPVIPEPEIRRRSILQFSKNYEDDSPTSTHELSFQQEEARRKLRNGIIYSVVLIAVFILAFIITDACIKISNEPLPPTTAYVPNTTQSTLQETTTAETISQPEEQTSAQE